MQGTLLKELGITILLLLSFQTLLYTPIPYISIIEVVFIVLLLFFANYYYFIRPLLLKQFVFSRLEIYIFILLLIPFYSALRAEAVFSQPLLYGVLTQRNVWLVISVLVLVYLVRRNLVTLNQIERVLVRLAWLSLIVFVVLGRVLDPRQYDGIAGFVGGGNVGEYEFGFSVTFIVFGFFYYAFRALRQPQRIDWLYALLFLLYLILIQQGRSLTVALLLSFLFFVYRWNSSRKLLIMAPLIIAVVSIGITIFYISFEEFSLGVLQKYLVAFTVLSTGDLSNDPSSNARIYETLLALPFIKRNWLLGNGDLSNQWDGGYKNILGYFFPTDIGVVGVLFVFGVAGLIIFFYQYALALQYALWKRNGLAHPLLLASKGFLLYSFLQSLVTATAAFLPAISLMFVAIIYLFTWHDPHGFSTEKNQN